jgi:pSer/pThr/pTyr-binding forkhead associated (FHA) protein
MASAAVKITTELRSPTQVGIYYRLVAMTGPNKGKVYYLLGKRIIIGRGEGVDIQIIDNKVSREHAEITFANESYTITDLGAHNGVVVNNVKISQKILEDAEKIVIGQTVFKYTVIHISESDTMLAVVKDGKKVFRPKIVVNTKIEEDIANTNEIANPEETVETTETKKNPKSLIMILVIGAVAYVLFSGD